MTSVEVRVPIRLGQFLKLAGLADSGVDATALVADGDVEVDGELEARRGRQLRGGEVVTVISDAYEASARVVALPGA